MVNLKLLVFRNTVFFMICSSLIFLEHRQIGLFHRLQLYAKSCELFMQ